MSPNEYNEDIFSLRERETIVTDIRSSYSFIFNQFVQIYKIHHQDDKLSTKAEEVADAVETLYNEGKINDYLYENFESCYSQNPDLNKVRVLIGNDLKIGGIRLGFWKNTTFQSTWKTHWRLNDYELR